MRVALKIGYDGTKFSGFAIQPNKRTVEGEILKRLIKTRVIDNRRRAKFQYASRTDRGVSAFGNVIAFNCKCGDVERVLKNIEDIWIFGKAMVDENFNPRHCISKTYRYYLINEGYDINEMKKCSSLFVGEHDFSSFARANGRKTIRKIDRIVIKGKKIIKIDIEAKSFLWNQVRRMVSAIMKVGRGEVDIEEVRRALCGERINFGIAPPQNLVLMDVKYNINFNYLGLPSDILTRRKMLEDLMKMYLEI